MATAAIWLEKGVKLRDSRNSRNDLWLSSALVPAMGGDDIIMPWLTPGRLSTPPAELHRWIAFYTCRRTGFGSWSPASGVLVSATSGPARRLRLRNGCSASRGLELMSELRNDSNN